jgi:hypothetical protein
MSALHKSGRRAYDCIETKADIAAMLQDDKDDIEAKMEVRFRQQSRHSGRDAGSIR